MSKAKVNMPKTYNQGTETNIINVMITMCPSGGGIAVFGSLFALLDFTFACASFNTSSTHT